MCYDTRMTFEEYQKRCGETAMYRDSTDAVLRKEHKFIYPALGLAGETGEVLEKIKKTVRDKGGVVDEETRQALAKELGDVMWYVAQLATELGLSLDEVASANVEKLQSRKSRGALHGSGDDR